MNTFLCYKHENKKKCFVVIANTTSIEALQVNSCFNIVHSIPMSNVSYDKCRPAYLIKANFLGSHYLTYFLEI